MSVDDKAIVPVGKSDCPVSTGLGIREYIQSLVSLEGPTLFALDYDFHVYRTVASVLH